MRIDKDSRLVIPMRSKGELHSLQFIGSDGSKKFLYGGRTEFCNFTMGKFGDVICIAESFSTAATIHEITGHAAVVAFSAGNLQKVAVATRFNFHNNKIILCADDDFHLKKNTGLIAARKAARSVGGLVAIPNFGSDRTDEATDFNDLAALRWGKTVARDIDAASAPPASVDSDTTRSITNKLRIVGLQDFMEMELPVRDKILEPWLMTQSLNMIHGWRGVGKTHISLGISYAVAYGDEFLNWKAEKPRRVLLVDGEMPAPVLQERLTAIIPSSGVGQEPEFLSLITPDLQTGAMPDLATYDGQEVISEAAKSVKSRVNSLG